ncbi:TrkH family potassium uptake protein [Halosegnis marinus]|uniref:TrkH family potassium uptake protein n=1 Tax=Halosegnis marinus TaxID=3034023 RepID=A0ABD5ZLQ2_9EURY
MTGRVVKYLSVALVVPLVVALLYGEDVAVFAVAGAATFLFGFAVERIDPDPDLGPREALLMVALTWLTVALVGTLPYLLAGMGTESTLANPVNALFESMSGFTTTGATVMGSISFERHSHALLMWRQLSQWLGGMGIVVLAVAILPELSVGGAQLMDAEAPGPGIEKLTPRIAETARALWLVYAAITLLEMLLLFGFHLGGLAPNMDGLAAGTDHAAAAYNAIAHGLTTMPTGGFSPEARSIEAFSAAVQWLIVPFMFAAGVNFALTWRFVGGNPRALLRDTEFRAYMGVIGVFTAVIAGVLFTGGIEPASAAFREPYGAIPGNAEASLRHAVFQALAMITTTGYASIDFNAWSQPLQYLLLFAMFVGGSAGSTGGGIKIVRWVVIIKSVKRELFTSVHPEAVAPVRLGGQPIDEDAVRGIQAFTLVYMLCFGVGAALIMLDAARVGYDISAFEGMAAAASTVGNVGPGFGVAGPMNSYLDFPATSKLLMVFLMWIGRLEILPVLVLLTRSYWRS